MQLQKCHKDKRERWEMRRDGGWGVERERGGDR